MEKKSQKLYHTDYNLLIAQDLWQAHHQSLLIILPQKIIKLNVKNEYDNNKYETCKNKYKDCVCFLEL